jgi:hypothetical protein
MLTFEIQSDRFHHSATARTTDLWKKHLHHSFICHVVKTLQSIMQAKIMNERDTTTMHFETTLFNQSSRLIDSYSYKPIIH